MRRIAGLVGLGLLAAGCATAPDARWAATQRSDDVSGDLMVHLACEIHQGMKGIAQPEAYVVVTSLSAKALTSGGAAPTLNFITTLSGSNTLTSILGGELSSTAAKTVTHNFRIDLSLVEEADCGRDRIRGGFGVDALIRREMTRKLPSGFAPNGDKEKGFAANIEFTLKSAFNGGPTWVRTHFKGPSDKGLFNAARTDTNTLIIVFTRVGQASDKRAALMAVNPALAALVPDETEVAERNARDLLNQMVLQNLLTSAQ